MCISRPGISFPLANADRIIWNGITQNRRSVKYGWFRDSGFDFGGLCSMLENRESQRTDVPTDWNVSTVQSSGAVCDPSRFIDPSNLMLYASYELLIFVSINKYFVSN